jgi:hypothetical protein
MSSPICIGPEFKVGSQSELLINGSRDGAWPYPIDFATYNELRRDTTRGLWVRPLPQGIAVTNSFSASPNLAVTGFSAVQAATGWVISNPNPAYALNVNIVDQVTGVFTLGAGGACCGEMYYVDNTSAGASLSLMATALQSAYTWRATFPFVYTLTIAAGGTATLNRRFQINSPAAGTLVSWSVVSVANGVAVLT